MNNPNTVYTVETVFTNPTKTGYTFEGWYTDALFTTEYTQGITGDLALFAKFTEKTTGLFATTKSTFNFHPNPTVDFIHTELAIGGVKILNLQGELIQEFNTNATTYDVSNLKPGTYVIIATSTQGVSYTAKLIKE